MAAIDRLFHVLPGDALMRIERAYGSALKRIADHRPGHLAIEIGHRLLAQVVGVAARAPSFNGRRTPEQIARKTMEKFFLPILQPTPEHSRDYTFEFTRCPYGLEAGSGELCHAIMNLEEQIVRRMGGELVIEARIAEGAPTCRFTVRNEHA